MTLFTAYILHMFSSTGFNSMCAASKRQVEGCFLIMFSIVKRGSMNCTRRVSVLVVGFGKAYDFFFLVYER